MKYIKVDSIAKLKELVTQGKTDFFIQLNFGARSSKHITEADENGKLEIENLIDGTTQVLSNEEIMDKNITNVGYAIVNGAFWCENI